MPRGTNKRTDIYVVHLVEMHIYYLLECIASRDVLKRVLSLIIQHIVDSGYTDCELLRNRKFTIYATRSQACQ